MVYNICMFFINNISCIYFIILYNKLFVSCSVLNVEADAFRLFFNVYALAGDVLYREFHFYGFF